MSMLLNLGKKVIFKLTSNVVLSNKDLLKMADRLDYPDLVRLICKKENVNNFSELCLEHLENLQQRDNLLCTLVKQTVCDYINRNTCSEYKENQNKVYLEMVGESKSIKELDVRNIIKRDAVYRKMIKHYLPEITSNDCNLLISTFAKLNEGETP